MDAGACWTPPVPRAESLPLEEAFRGLDRQEHTPLIPEVLSHPKFMRQHRTNSKLQPMIVA